MSMLMRMAAAATVPPTLSVEDVFSAYTYTGNGSTQSIVNGVDLATKGGLVWVKTRDLVAFHALTDTVRTRDKVVYADTTGAEQSPIADKDITSFNLDGFSLGPEYSSVVNRNTKLHILWSFAQANKFFKVATATFTASPAA